MKSKTVGLLSGGAGTLGLVLSAGLAAAQVMGMPGLDATKPLGQTEKPKADTSGGDMVPPTFTAAQVDRGRKAYMGNCVDCHGDQLNNGEFGGAPLTGSYFQDHWGGVTVDALYGYLSSAMPPNKPGALSAQVYTDITTFLLAKNGYAAGSTEMPANPDAMASMLIKE